MNGRKFTGGAALCAAAGLRIGGALAEGEVRAGDFGEPRVIVSESVPARAHLAWPKIASDGGGNLVVGLVAAREHVEGNGVIGCAVSSDGGRTEKCVSRFDACRKSFTRRMWESFYRF